jgi:hypothetical protein
MNPPRVFVSYSHDSTAHKKWVLEFATTLRNRGVDAVLDQWDLKPGDDLPHFMETQLESADFASMICTEKYVEKANAGEGGVGYEKMIMTSSMLSKIDSNKVIPIIRQNGSKDRPTFMKSKLYIDFSNDEDAEYNLDDLLRVLLDAPLYKKPEIGANPFKPMEEARPDRTSDGVREVMIAVSKTYDESIYEYITFPQLIKNLTMQRLTLDRYLKEAEHQGLIKRPQHKIVIITSKGLDYLVAKGIIEA